TRRCRRGLGGCCRRRLRGSLFGASSEGVSRAQPPTPRERRDYDGSKDPSQPRVLRRDHRRAASPDGNTWAVPNGCDIFCNCSFLIQAEVPSHCAHESPVEDPAGKMIPLFVFDGLQEAFGNARGSGYLVQSDGTHFAFASKALAKSASVHSSL